LYLYKLQYQPRDVAPLLVYIFIPAFFGDVIRFSWPAFNRLWTGVMGPLMRDREKQQWNGVIFYLLGAWIVLSFFPKVRLLVILANNRILRSYRFYYCRGQIRLLRHSVVSMASTVHHSDRGSLSLDPLPRCSRALSPHTCTGDCYTHDMNRMSLLIISTGPNILFSISVLPAKEVFHGLVQRVNSPCGSCVV
jgi:hypothetical protein